MAMSTGAVVVHHPIPRLEQVLLVIPAFEPDERLVELVRDLRFRAPGCEVLVVDDGSGPRFARVFEWARSAGAIVIGTPDNRGKAAALRAGFAWAMARRPGRAVICADSDGQHRVHDILRVAEVLQAYEADAGGSEGAVGATPLVVLGGRRFAGAVPARSRFGNGLSRFAFRFATGTALHDTQTGLRGYPARALPWLLDVPGERFAYELQILLDASNRGYGVVEVPIDTVYLDHNASSHFRPVVDSMRVLLPLLVYSASSLLSFLVDTVALLVLHAATNSLLVSVLGARVVSASGNFVLNRQLVFRRRRRAAASADEPPRTSIPLRAQVLRYGSLAVALLVANYLALAGLTALGAPLLPAKVATEGALYLVSFHVQRVFVFGRRSRVERRHAHAGSTPATDLARAA
ncbi:bifunctional glycosyltransferase family 2/GtrA family protein [Plantibacter flavus]|uniref:glycosyltransferase n=1 Tax=Plantibacter flavus TaxID=150123 RepID=UPI003F1540EC